jgi:glycosyltransferase involved in cell wall biosynthesis
MNVTDSSSAQSSASPENEALLPSLLLVITKANWGGGQRYVFDVASAAQEAGHEVAVAFGPEGELSLRLSQRGIPTYPIRGMVRDVSLKGDATSLLALIALIKKIRPDIVHANSSKAGLVATIAARLAGVQQIIFTAHGWAFNESRPKWQKLIFALFHIVTVWCSDEVICVSEAVKQDAQWMPFAKGKFTVIHNGIEKSELIGKETLSATTWIGNLAELHPTKAQDISIEAFSRIAEQFPDTALVFIGEGQYRASLEKMVRGLGLGDRVHFCGHVLNAPQFLSAFDIFLFPSRSEALAYAVLEAGNASLPVVASRVGGIPEIVDDAVTGLLVKKNDVDGFVRALTSLLEKDASPLRSKLGSALNAKIEKEFSKQAMLEQTLALYK